MKTPAFLDAMRGLPIVTALELTNGHPFLVLSPHPDDETLGTGGLIALASTAGISIDVVVLTDGSGSHPNSANYPKKRLVELRKQEVSEAGAIMGLLQERIHYLNLIDTQAPMSGAPFDHAVYSITKLVNETGARSLFVTWEMDPHCDHKAAAIMAKAVCQNIPDLKLWAYPIWGWHLDADVKVDHAPPKGVRLDISDHLALKRHAIQAHKSQMTDLIADDVDGFRFTDETLHPFLGQYEHFLEVKL